MKQLDKKYILFSLLFLLLASLIEAFGITEVRNEINKLETYKIKFSIINSELTNCNLYPGETGSNQKTRMKNLVSIYTRYIKTTAPLFPGLIRNNPNIFTIKNMEPDQIKQLKQNDLEQLYNKSKEAYDYLSKKILTADDKQFLNKSFLLSLREIILGLIMDNRSTNTASYINSKISGLSVNIFIFRILSIISFLISQYCVIMASRKI